jgi:RNA polymerase sigma-70 factor (ECF subfamily)
MQGKGARGGFAVRDEEIVALYWQRNEDAIRETEQRYGRYLFKIAYQVLADPEDSEESVNDTYLKAWSAMPPHRPGVLSTFLGRLTRQLSIDRRRARNREKRRPSEYALSLSELEECVSGGDLTRETVDFHLLAEAINAYLLTLSPEARGTFVGRYYYMDPVREIARYFGMSESKAKSMLHRTRLGLRRHLEQEGFL